MASGGLEAFRRLLGVGHAEPDVSVRHIRHGLPVSPVYRLRFFGPQRLAAACWTVEGTTSCRSLRHPPPTPLLIGPSAPGAESVVEEAAESWTRFFLFGLAPGAGALADRRPALPRLASLFLLDLAEHIVPAD